MAAPLQVRIDQVFHGYDRGHKELASSLRLDDASRSKMLVYSDLLADARDGTEAAYLTCYPLPAASRHVLARTWPAGAQYRPGSVWTHSLVLDYQALAVLADLVALEPVLLRSGSVDRRRPAEPIFVRPEIATAASPPLGPNAAAAVQGLYGRSEGEVTVTAGRGPENDLLALALWRQMWPGLRREFTFVTGPGVGRPAAGTRWMLRFAKVAAQSGEDRLGRGAQALLDDLPAPGPTPLRRFLSRYAVESPDARRVAAPLAEIWLTSPDGFEERLRALRRLTASIPLPRLTRDLVSAELEAVPGPRLLLAAVREFGDQPLDADPALVVRKAEAMDDASLDLLLSSSAEAPAGGLGSSVFEAAVKGVDPHRLAALAGGRRTAMMRLRPALIEFRRSGRTTTTPAPRWWTAVRTTSVSRLDGSCQGRDRRAHDRGAPPPGFESGSLRPRRAALRGKR